MHPGQIATGAPLWVWVLLAGLVLLGLRRLRTREMPIALAMLPAIAFLGWNLWNAFAYTRLAGAAVMLAVVAAGAVIGAATAVALPEPRGQRLPGNRVRLPGTVLPLLVFLTIFVARFGCGAWAAIVPGAAARAAGLALAVGAATTARLIIGVVRWTGARPAHA